MSTLTVNVPAKPEILRNAVTIVTAGAFATLAFDFFGQSLSPWLGFAKLAPVGLANAVLQNIFGAGFAPAAEALHYFAGIVAYAFGWVAIVEPLRRRLAPTLHWSLAAVAYGVALWIFALYGMAHLIAGMPPFLGFTGITWVALVGHVVYALVAAAVTNYRQA